jgi:hypothetical protein
MSTYGIALEVCEGSDSVCQSANNGGQEALDSVWCTLLLSDGAGELGEVDRVSVSGCVAVAVVVTSRVAAEEVELRGGGGR